MAVIHVTCQGSPNVRLSCTKDREIATSHNIYPERRLQEAKQTFCVYNNRLLAYSGPRAKTYGSKGPL